MVLCLLPCLVRAQAVAVVAPDSSTADLYQKMENDFTVDFSRSDTLDIRYGMPIYNPGSKAVIKVFRPSDDLIFNMPVLGKQPAEGEKVAPLRAWFFEG